MSGRCDEQDDLTLVYLWARKEVADEIEQLRKALQFIVAYSDCHQSARDAARRALAKMKPFEDRWDNE